MFTSSEVSNDFVSLCPALEEEEVFQNEKHGAYETKLVVCECPNFTFLSLWRIFTKFGVNNV